MATDRKQVRLFFKQHALEAPLKNGTHAFVTAIEVLGIDTVQLPHSSGQGRLGYLNDQVIVVIHQHVCMNEPSKPTNDIVEDIKKNATIITIQKDCLALGASARDVIDRTWKFNANGSGHKDPWQPDEVLVSLRSGKS